MHFLHVFLSGVFFFFFFMLSDMQSFSCVFSNGKTPEENATPRACYVLKKCHGPKKHSKSKRKYNKKRAFLVYSIPPYCPTAKKLWKKCSIFPQNVKPCLEKLDNCGVALQTQDILFLYGII